jgi:hypothetical protein
VNVIPELIPTVLVKVIVGDAVTVGEGAGVYPLSEKLSEVIQAGPV